MIRHIGSLIFFILMLSSFSSGAPLVFTLGYIRTSAPDVDSVNTLAGFLSTVQYANTHNLVPGVRFQLNVTTIPCRNYSECADRSPANNQLLQDFIVAMPGFSAILKPNYVLANTIVDEATRLGGIPVLDADDIRMTSFQNGSEHIINFNANWQRQIDHLFTYMHQTDRCVHTGIAHGTAATDDYPVHIARIHQLFAAANFPLPPSISSLTASDADFETFFKGDSRRRCFIFLGSNRLLVETVKRLQKINFDFTEATFYGVSSVVGDTWLVDGSANAFVNTKFIQWGPQFESPLLLEAYTEFLLNIGDYAHLFGVGAPPTTMNSTYTFQAYLTMVYLFETIRDAVANEANPNTTGPLPLAWSKIVDSFYADARSIEGYRFNPLARACPRAPMKQICFCNTLTRTSYIFGINPKTGIVYPTFDDVAKGQRNIASLEIENGCGYFASAWSYPITGLALYPSELMGNGQRTESNEAYDVHQVTYGTMTYETNYAPTAPTRALRYAAYDIHANESLQAALDTYIETIRPFVIYGSMTGKITESRGVLTLATSLVDIEMEDPPLVPHSQWRWDIVSVQPVVADYIHGLVGYYAQNSARFGSVHAIACTQRGAELISMSFATWGFDVPLSAIVVSDDPVVWAGLLKSWLGTDANPFVMAVTAGTNNTMAVVAASTAAAVGKGTIAIGCPLVRLYEARMATILNGTVEVLFGSFRTAWWTPEETNGIPAAIQPYVYRPRYQIAMLGLSVAQQLYTKVYFDFTTTAAQVLYRTSVISAADTSFGPFSNDTCSDEIIAANSRDRSCQCAKGTRTIYVHSMRDYQDGVASSRTGGYYWTMSTCGVAYRPYVPPFVPNGSISSGTIAGIAAGCSLALLLVVAAFVANSLFFSRNNRAAPKDPTKPFAIVFTDIQASTSLWARAPAAMSEAVDHHHQIMRKALRKNNGYEVKTVGDSFMVAFKDAADASRFALDAQVMLHAADWSAELDATYVELIAEAEEHSNEQIIHVGAMGHDFNNHLMALYVSRMLRKITSALRILKFCLLNVPVGQDPV